jgi:Ni,Fe-hydrogenase I large subunit
MKTKFYKTEHFLFRQWDRGIEDDIIDKITTQLKTSSKTKSIIIVSNSFFKKAGYKIKKNTNLIIVSKGKALLTLFFVDDLYAYLKSKKGNISSIIL